MPVSRKPRAIKMTHFSSADAWVASTEHGRPCEVMLRLNAPTLTEIAQAREWIDRALDWLESKAKAHPLGRALDDLTVVQ